METEDIFLDEYDPDDQIVSKIKEETIKLIPNKWEWDFFGNGVMIFALPSEASWSQRFWTKRFFNSKWKRL